MYLRGSAIDKGHATKCGTARKTMDFASRPDMEI
jgi:hypothetical protein